MRFFATTRPAGPAPTIATVFIFVIRWLGELSNGQKSLVFMQEESDAFQHEQQRRYVNANVVASVVVWRLERIHLVRNCRAPQVSYRKPWKSEKGRKKKAPDLMSVSTPNSDQIPFVTEY